MHLFTHPATHLTIHPSTIHLPFHPPTYPSTSPYLSTHLFTHPPVYHPLTFSHTYPLSTHPLFTHLPTHPPTYPSTHLFTQLPTQPPAFSPTHPPTPSPIHPPTYLSTHLPISPTHPPTYPSTCLFTNPPTHLPIHATLPAGRPRLGLGRSCQYLRLVGCEYDRKWPGPKSSTPFWPPTLLPPPPPPAFSAKPGHSPRLPTSPWPPLPLLLTSVSELVAPTRVLGLASDDPSRSLPSKPRRPEPTGDSLFLASLGSLMEEAGWRTRHPESTSPPTPPSPPQPKQPTQGGKKERKRERGERNVNGCIYTSLYGYHITRGLAAGSSFLRAATLKENLPKTGSPDIRKSSRLSIVLQLILLLIWHPHYRLGWSAYQTITFTQNVTIQTDLKEPIKSNLVQHLTKTNKNKKQKMVFHNQWCWKYTFFLFVLLITNLKPLLPFQKKKKKKKKKREREQSIISANKRAAQKYKSL